VNIDKMLLWSFLMLGLASLFFSFKGNKKEKLIIFFLVHYIAIFVSVIIKEENMIDYPVRFLPQYFGTPLLFEYLLFPLVNVWFYSTTQNSSRVYILLQAVMYSGLLSFVEFFLERYTDLIEYNTWTIWHTFFSEVAFFLFVRWIIGLIQEWAKEN
jgi:hypothetical protein